MQITWDSNTLADLLNGDLFDRITRDGALVKASKMSARGTLIIVQLKADMPNEDGKCLCSSICTTVVNGNLYKETTDKHYELEKNVYAWAIHNSEIDISQFER